MTRKTKPFWQIEMAAENILKHHECYNAPYSGIDFIIECCKIDLIQINTDNQKLMGMFGNDGNGHRFIVYNKNMIPERILFTKAHELGHFILEHKLKSDILIDNKNDEKDPQETEANVFASALLMPKESAIKVIKKSLEDMQLYLDEDGKFNYVSLHKEQKECLISAMKQNFHTSKEAIEWRIQNLFI